MPRRRTGTDRSRTADVAWRVRGPWGTTKVQVLLAVLAGAAACAVLVPAVDASLGIMGGITVGEVVFLLLSCLTLWPMSGEETEANVGREDLTPVADEVLVALVCVLAMVSMVTLHLGASEGPGAHAAGAALTLLGVFGAWACVHQTYAVHYAYRYYLEENGGVDFNSANADGTPWKPAFADFLYLAYAVGMTYGVTDNTVTDRSIRTIVLRHSLVSFVFGMVILGAGVNLVTGVFGLS